MKYANTRSLLSCLAAPVAMLLAASAAPAALRLPAVISDHAMLQAGKPDAIWGWADAGDTVTVTFRATDGKTEEIHATAGPDGRWAGQLPALAAGTAGQLLVHTVKGEGITLDDILVGEVWLCGGQSNMSYLLFSHSRNKNESTTPQIEDAAKADATAAAGALRYFRTEHKICETALDDVKGKWIVATPETVGQCFSLSWNFAVALRGKIHEPVGLLNSAIGGTCVESWTPRAELDACSAGPDLETYYQTMYAHYKDDIKAQYEKDLAAWTQKYPTSEAQAQHAAEKPLLNSRNNNTPARLYNGMIHGLEPYTLKGVIWFQGDGNCYHPANYGVLFKTLITSWRAHFHDAALPFYYVEMQNYSKPQEKPVEPNALSEIREQQQAALELPGVDVATGVDQGIRIPNYEAHFPDKKQLGTRMANLALAHLFGQPGLLNSPQLKSFKIEGSKVRLHLDYADGLRLRGAEAAGFAIRGAGGEWVCAKGQIEGQEIVLWSDQVPSPADVRYAWAYNPTLSVENSAGLPLRPFRTDTTSPK